MMKIKSAEFVTSATKPSQYPPVRLPEIAFAGRSNVGKSSLINCIVRRKSLAKTSSTPGRTQIINFFSIDDTWMFVDLPGYGYAKVPQRIRAGWAAMIEEFLLEEGLKLVVLIVDARHQPTKLDRQVVEWMTLNHIPCQRSGDNNCPHNCQDPAKALNLAHGSTDLSQNIHN